MQCPQSASVEPTRTHSKFPANEPSVGINLGDANFCAMWTSAFGNSPLVPRRRNQAETMHDAHSWQQIIYLQLKNSKSPSTAEQIKATREPWTYMGIGRYRAEWSTLFKSTCSFSLDYQSRLSKNNVLN
jgi:hypothetical protein